ncbi:unnamed protein product [Darwinula stevensoni]|uniref:Uncharacterized protein n=1 Tax=Darwinula stevensoni TaxID=69355 RepID=A0A7R8X7Q0_9CRUS|nr:unnamed protein product [Darwinula stevensoni]CAG0887255.1 unnamed protein product [Darwinula stevensoni]
MCSLLGDKTRMHELSRDPNAYIRPSPSGGKLGGVARNTQDAIYLCECAGYKIIFIETVGVGQSELAVADMVDAFVLLIPPGGGDELQGIKKGIIERSHFICITKADGDLIPAARRIQYDYLSAIKYMRPVSQNWKTKVMRISAFTGEGLKELWGDLEKYHQMMVSCGEFFSNRKDQRKSWMWNYIADNIVSIFKQHPAVKKKLNEMERQVIEGISTPGIAAEVLLKEFIKEVP